MDDNLTRDDIRLTDRAFLLLIIAPLAGMLPVLQMMRTRSCRASLRASWQSSLACLQLDTW